MLQYSLALIFFVSVLAHGEPANCDAAAAKLGDLSGRSALLAKYGSGAKAALTTQPGMEYFQTSNGYVAFNTDPLGIAHVLGDPVASPDHAGHLLDEFLKAHRNPVFWNVSSNTAQLIAERGYYVNTMGMDVTFDVQNYSLGGKEKESLRRSINKVDKAGYKLVELYERDGFDTERAKAITTSWLRGKVQNNHEMRFMTPAIDYHDQTDVRKFYLQSPTGALEALFYFYPIYREDKVIGYTLEVRRKAAEAPQGAEHFGFAKAMEIFKSEGKETLSLALMPMHGADQYPIRPNPLVTKVFKGLYDSKFSNKYLYNFQGQSEAKLRYKGTEVPMYFGMNKLISPWRMIAGIYLSDSIPFFKTNLQAPQP